MIIFDFQINENTLAEDKRTGIANASAATLLLTYFEMPVRLNIDGLEIFQRANLLAPIWAVTPEGQASQTHAELVDDWLTLPLLGVAMSIPKLARQACEERKTFKYNTPEGEGNLIFNGDDRLLKISSTFNKQIAEVPCKEFVEASENFACRVKKVLQELAPELLQHTDAKSWLQSD